MSEASSFVAYLCDFSVISQTKKQAVLLPGSQSTTTKCRGLYHDSDEVIEPYAGAIQHHGLQERSRRQVIPISCYALLNQFDMFFDASLKLLLKTDLKCNDRTRRYFCVMSRV